VVPEGEPQPPAHEEDDDEEGDDADLQVGDIGLSSSTVSVSAIMFCDKAHIWLTTIMVNPCGVSSRSC